MVLAVPITAVLRIHLAHVQHPLPRYIAQLIGGGHERSSSMSGSASGRPAPPAAFRKLPPALAAGRSTEALVAVPDVEASAGLLARSDESSPPEPRSPSVRV